MKQMKYEWIVFYNNGEKLSQFVENKENLFKDIDQDRLEKFQITDGEQYLTVNLVDGTFNLNNTIIEIPEISNRQEKYRLIYFRRVSVSIGTEGSSNRTVESFIGFQITINNKNYKIMFSELNDTFRLHIK